MHCYAAAGEVDFWRLQTTSWLLNAVVQCGTPIPLVYKRLNVLEVHHVEQSSLTHLLC